MTTGNGFIDYQNSFLGDMARRQAVLNTQNAVRYGEVYQTPTAIEAFRANPVGFAKSSILNYYYGTTPEEKLMDLVGTGVSVGSAGLKAYSSALPGFLEKVATSQIGKRFLNGLAKNLGKEALEEAAIDSIEDNIAQGLVNSIATTEDAHNIAKSIRQIKRRR